MSEFDIFAPVLAKLAAIQDVCPTCNGPMIDGQMGRPRIYCSAACARASDAAKDRKRASKAVRRARLAKAPIVETINPFTVFRAANWHCALCGVHTPESLRGSYADNAPELDHIIPLSRGGHHTISNLQCLCRRCNRIKSDKMPSKM